MKKWKLLTALVLLLISLVAIMRMKKEKKLEENIMGEGLYSADVIAKWFLYYNDKILEEQDSDMISNLKLQKLLYYAQGCCLAMNGYPLFDDNIVNWEHGPVVEEVYHHYKSNGSGGIEYQMDYNESIDEETEALLVEVYDVFGKYSAWGLRNMTHNEDPWKNTNRNSIIPTSLIKNYFEKHYISE